MAERDHPRQSHSRNPALRGDGVTRKLPSARRLLVATIGAATVTFAPGCDATSHSLPAPPSVPQSGSGGFGLPGSAGQGGFGLSGRGGQGGNPGHFVANLMAPPFVPQPGTGGRGGAGGIPGRAGQGGASGAAGADPTDMDAGTDDDAGQA